MFSWNFNMWAAPRNDRQFIMIAVKHSKKVRRCIWNPYDRTWTGLLEGEEPLAFMVVTHPNIKSKDLFLP